MTTDSDKMTDDEWLLRAIETAQCMERLEFIRRVIVEDTEAGAEYTKDETLMASYRAAWKKRAGEIESGG